MVSWGPLTRIVPRRLTVIIQQVRGEALFGQTELFHIETKGEGGGLRLWEEYVSKQWLERIVSN
jgi:hypothetical protein